VSPCLSLAPLSATISNNSRTTAKKISKRMVKMTEIVAGVLLSMISPEIFQTFLVESLAYFAFFPSPNFLAHWDV
jgi:hypothetical protein